MTAGKKLYLTGENKTITHGWRPACYPIAKHTYLFQQRRHPFLCLSQEAVTKFKKSVTTTGKEFYKALQSDLKKSPEESWVTETGFFY